MHRRRFTKIDSSFACLKMAVRKGESSW